MPKCKVCNREIDLEHEKWVKPYNREYAHTNCYKDWNENKNNISIIRPNQFWYYALTDYLIRDLKLPVNFLKMRSQWNNFLPKFTAKGMYFTIRYLYFIQHNNPDKASGGIGLINDNTYKEAQEYWQERYRKQMAFKEDNHGEIKKTIIVRQSQKRNKLRYNFSDVEGDE